MHSRATPLIAVIASCAAVLAAIGGPAHAAPPPVPVVPGTVDFDPRLALLPVGARINTAQADADRAARGKVRAQQQQQRIAAAPAPKAYAEREAAGATGANDTAGTAEPIPGFGTSRGRNPKAVVTGDLAEGPVPVLPQPAEDNGSIPLATDTGIAGTRSVVRTSGVIGDGPHGSTGTGTGDFDFYKLTVPTGTQSMSIDVTATGDLNAVVLVWYAGGTMLSYLDPPGADVHTSVLLGAGDWYVSVNGFGTYPRDPFDSGSGFAPGTEGAYTVRLAAGHSGDQDWYSVDLRAGDVLGATVSGGSRELSFHNAAGTELHTSSTDASGSYSLDSPLPGGGNATVDLVAPRNGRYLVAVRSGVGPYSMKLEAYRPGTETARAGTVQTLFLDFDGARVNTSMFQQRGRQVDLSPLKTFLPAWGLTAADENRIIDAAVASVKENISRDLAARGSNPNFAIRILNSRDHADPFGRPGVSRVVVGGSSKEVEIDTIGIAQSIDPGNFAHEETALLLLDYVSLPAPNPNSFNTYVAPGADKAAFIGRSLGTYAAHEAGHFSGTWHTVQTNNVANVMDQGGNPAQMLGVGPDGKGGTADDVDVDFVTDDLDAPFTGSQDTLNRMAWAYSRGRG